MAFLDTQTEFSDAQAVTVTTISTNQLDALTLTKANAAAALINVNPRIDYGIGEEAIWLVVSTNTTVTDVGSDATLLVTFESADDSLGSVNPTVHLSTATLPFASYATAGTILLLARIPSALYRRWMYVRFTVTNGPFTAGAFDAYFTNDPQMNRGYKSGYKVF